MSESARQLIAKHHSFYEVVPYYVVIEEAHGRSVHTTRRSQVGFDVDIYGLKTSDDPGFPSSSVDYARAYSILQQIVDEIARNTGNSCSIELFGFGSTVFPDTRNGFHPEAMLRIRITHLGNLDQPIDVPEHNALEEIETQLLGLGIGAGRSAH